MGAEIVLFRISHVSGCFVGGYCTVAFFITFHIFSRDSPLINESTITCYRQQRNHLVLSALAEENMEDSTGSRAVHLPSELRALFGSPRRFCTLRPNLGE